MVQGDTQHLLSWNVVGYKYDVYTFMGETEKFP